MTVTYEAVGEMTQLAGFLVLPGIGVILLILGVWQLSRGLKGLGGDLDSRYDVVLRGRRTREGRLVVIRGGGAVMTFLGVILLTTAAMQAVLALAA